MFPSGAPNSLFCLASSRADAVWRLPCSDFVWRKERQHDYSNKMSSRQETQKSTDPSVGVWEQLHWFCFAGGFWGGEDGLGPFTVGARPEPGRSDDGKPHATKKLWSCSHTPTEGRRQWRQPSNKYRETGRLRQWRDTERKQPKLTTERRTKA